MMPSMSRLSYSTPIYAQQFCLQTNVQVFVRHVKATPMFQLTCECLLSEETGIICRHIIRVAKSDHRFAHVLSYPCDDIWLNSRFIDCFKDFQVVMPSTVEVDQCSGDMFPGTFKIPKHVAQRGRPRTKRLKGFGEQQFKRKMRHLTGTGDRDTRQQCSVCRTVGHRKNVCPLRAEFKL